VDILTIGQHKKISDKDGYGVGIEGREKEGRKGEEDE
jgi:hypothetical protein